MDNFKLLGDRILIKQDHVQETTKSGLFIPPNERNKQSKGKIVDLGPGSDKVENPGFKPGDYILFAAHSGMDIKLDGFEGEALLLLRFSDIIGIYTEEEKFIV